MLYFNGKQINRLPPAMEEKIAGLEGVD